jgi:uncharacterized membrane protein YcaP (DUF421 family)
MDAVTGLFSGIDLGKMLVPSTPLAEVFLRGTIVYVILFCVLRYLMKRQTGSIGIADLLVIVLIADAAQNSLTAGQESLAEGVVLVLTIVFWNHVINWLGHRTKLFKRFSRPPAVPIVRNGKAVESRLRAELITREELDSQLRLHGVADISKVREAWVGAMGASASSSIQRMRLSRLRNRNLPLGDRWDGPSPCGT